jgi:hypothetical protein
MMKKTHQKTMVSKVLQELERLLHGAIDEDRVGNLNVFEMIMVSADTLNNTYRKTKSKKKGAAVNNVVEFRKK